jgi:PhnB protein
MASDATDNCGGGGYPQAQGMWISISVDDATEGGRIVDALAEGGKVTMPFQATFWSPGFGMVTDRFNTPWMVNVKGEA